MLKLLFCGIKNVIDKIRDFIIKNGKWISEVLILIYTFFAIIGWIHFSWWGYLSFYFVMKFMKFWCEIINEKEKEVPKFPRMKKRYTIKSTDGNIRIKNDDLEMAMLYLSVLEDYLERNPEL